MKAQSEILGLAMIMVIVTIGLAVLVRFSIQSSQRETDFVNTFTENELPLYLNNALLETNIQECYGEKLSRILMKCTDGTSFICKEDFSFDNKVYQSSNRGACEMAKSFLAQALNETLGKNYFEYRYFVYTGNDYRYSSGKQIMNITNSNCYRKSIKNPGILFFRVGGGKIMQTKLDICTEP